MGGEIIRRGRSGRCTKATTESNLSNIQKASRKIARLRSVWALLRLVERSVVQINGQRFDETYESCRGTVGRTNAREDGEVKKIAIDRLFSKGYEVQRLLEGGLEYFVEWARDQFHDLPSFTDIYASTISAHPPRDFGNLLALDV